MEIEFGKTEAELLAELMRLVVIANIRWRRRRVYALRYENAMWVTVLRRKVAFDGWEYVIPLDTRCTADNLRAALAAMRNEIKSIEKEKTA